MRPSVAHSSVVCLSVGHSVTVLSPAKTAELIEMPFGVGPMNYVLDRVQIEAAISRGKTFSAQHMVG